MPASTTPAEKRSSLKSMLGSGKLNRFPGAFSPLVALAIQDHGFEGVYVSGAALSADLGLPDIGLTTLSEVAERLLLDISVTGVVGVGQAPGITGMDLAAGFSSYLGRPVSFSSLLPEAFGELIAPLFGADAAAGVVAGYQAQARASANAITQDTSAQRLLGLTPRSLQQWLTDISA